MQNAFDYQYCQKIVVFSKDYTKVLLAKRQGEQDYDGVYSFIGGKIEHDDADLLAGLKREKDEEVGADFKINIYHTWSRNLYFVKKDGSHMVLPHYLAVHESGDIVLNTAEYSEYIWADVATLNDIKPAVENVPYIAEEMLQMRPLLESMQSTVI